MSVLEATPRYSVEHLDDGRQETVQLLVSLPGVAESRQIVFTIEDTRHLRVHVPGRYRADIPLSVDVEGMACSVQFLKKKELLKATLLVAGHGITASGHASRQQEVQSEERRQQEPLQQQAVSTSMPPPKDQTASLADHSDHAGLGSPLAVAAEKPAQQQQQQQQAAAPQQQPYHDPAPVGPSATSPREERDAQMYAAAAQHSNREAAAECFAKAQLAEQAGDMQHAQRLLHKACKLDPGNLRYGTVLQASTGIATDSGGGSTGACSSQAAGSCAVNISTGGGRGCSATSGDASAAWEPAAGQAQAEVAGGHHTSHQERRCQQRQVRQQEAAVAAEAAAEALQAALAREKARKARIAAVGYAFAGLACACAMLAAQYWLVLLAPAAAPLADTAGSWKQAAARVAGPLLFLPRVLFWQATWTMAILWAAAGGSACCALKCVDRMQQGWELPPLVPVDGYVVGLMAAWHPLLWCACGGGWGAVAGTLTELLPVVPHLLGKSVYGHILLYPLACFVLRLSARWLLLPLGRTLATPPVLWLWRHLFWRPSWWLSLPLAALLYTGASVTAKQPQAERFVPSAIWMLGAMCTATCWLLGGGWWAVAHQAAVSAAFAALLLAMLKRWAETEAQLTRHFRALPALFLIARLLVGILWMGAGGWTWAAGMGAGGLLYLHVAGLQGAKEAGDGGWGGGGRGGRGRGGGQRAAGAPPTAIHHLQHDVPAGAPQAVVRILKAGNYYEVLGVEAEADEAAIRRAKRALSLATHPDKIGDAPGANDAFNLVTEASDVLGDAEARRQYDTEMADASLSAGFRWVQELRLSPEDLAASGIPPQFAGRMQEFVDAMDHGDIPQQCDLCGSIHFLRRTDRPMAAARQCDDCGTRHAVRHNEVWFESASAGFMRRTIHMYCCYKGVVYDMSEGADCEGTLHAVHERAFPLNRHVNFFKGFGLSTGGGSGGGGKKGRGGGQQQAAPPRTQGPRGAGSKKKSRRR